jgi:hypothetical protein
VGVSHELFTMGTMKEIIMWPTHPTPKGGQLLKKYFPVTGRSQGIRLGIPSMSEGTRDEQFRDALNSRPADCGGIEGCFFAVFPRSRPSGDEDRYKSVCRY